MSWPETVFYTGLAWLVTLTFLYVFEQCGVFQWVKRRVVTKLNPGEAEE